MNNIDEFKARLENGPIRNGPGMRDLQNFLNDNGFDAGPADGIMGDGTAKGLGLFLRAHPDFLLNASGRAVASLQGMGLKSTLSQITASTPGLQEGLVKNARDTLAQKPLTAMSRDEIMTIQKDLSLTGYYSGTIDGIARSRTLSAAARLDNGALSADPARSGLAASFSEHHDGSASYGIAPSAISQAWQQTFGEENALLQNVSYQPQQAGGPPLIVIDLGHGEPIGQSKHRTTSGAISPVTGQYERDLVSSVGQGLAEALHQKGYNVAFTREPGQPYKIPYDSEGEFLASRSRFAHNLGGITGAGTVIFISLHGDSMGKNRQPNGAHVYTASTVNNPDSKALARSIAQSYQVRPGVETGVLKKDLGVLRNFEEPGQPEGSGNASVLLELGYLSNRHDAQALAEMGKHPEQAAAQIAAGIDQYVMSVRPDLGMRSEIKPEPEQTAAPAPSPS